MDFKISEENLQISPLEYPPSHFQTSCLLQFQNQPVKEFHWSFPPLSQSNPEFLIIWFCSFADFFRLDRIYASFSLLELFLSPLGRFLGFLTYWFVRMSMNPRTGQPYLQRYYEILETKKKLPVCEKKDEFLQALKNNQILILVGEPGYEKTTQVSLQKLGNFVYIDPL